MPEPRDSFGSKMYALIMFLTVSLLAGLLLAGFAVPTAAMAGMAATTVSDALEELPAELETPPLSEGSKMVLEDGTVIATLFSENRKNVTLDEIAPVMRQAQVAIEDRRFYEHGALDFQGLMRALLVSGGEQGGSTITQQVVKLTRLENAVASGDQEAIDAATERTINRKLIELRYAIAMERKFTKDQILERYLNIAMYGQGNYGVEAAARRYFNVSAKDLNLAQAAQLAGMVQNPSATDPLLHPKASIERRNLVLAAMLDLKMITKDQYTEAKSVKFNRKNVQPVPNGCASAMYPHICDYALRELTQHPALGTDVAERLNAINRGGFTFVLSIDKKMQDVAEKSLAARIDPKDPAIATASIVKPGDGRILALAQSRPRQGNQPGETFHNYNVTQEMGGIEGFQAGSTFKIFTVAAALQEGVPASKTYRSPGKIELTDETWKACSGPFKLQDEYTAYNDHNWSGTPDMWDAAKYSVNTYFLQLERDVGICEVAKVGDATGIQMGLQGNLTEGIPSTGEIPSRQPSLTLGAVDVAPLSLANAYATFAANGKYCPNYLVVKMTTRDGEEIQRQPTTCEQRIDANVARGTNQIMSGVPRSGTGTATYVAGYDQAGKTGTTNEFQNALYVGYTPDISLAITVSIDKVAAYWVSDEWRGTPTLREMRLPVSGTWMSGYGSPDATNLFTPIWREVLPMTEGNRFADPANDVLEGKKVEVPRLTLTNPDEDERILTEAGFTVNRTEVYSSWPKGTYLGPDKTGTLPYGSVINLRFSIGPAPVPEKPKETKEPKETTKPSATTKPKTTKKAKPTTDPQPTESK